MTKDEALKMAIEAMTKADNYFEQLCSLLITFGVSPSELNMHKDTFLIKPINACKEALEQPLTRDWKHTIDERIARDIEFKDALEQPAQEPVAWMNVSKDAGFKQVTVFQEPTSKKSIPLYTHPHQWQGLTDDEIDKIYCATYGTGSIDIDIEFARAIEAKLKEKSHA